MFCKNCGKEIPEDATFCPNCGTAVEKDAPNAPLYTGAVNNYAPQSAPKDTSNTIAVAGFVLSFFIAIAGLICSIIGFNKARKEGLEHKGLALAGIIISALSMVSSVLIYSLIIVPMLDVIL